MKTIAVILLGSLCLSATAAPVVFWAPDKTAPGDLTLLYGGGLGNAQSVQVRSLDEGSATVSAPALQPCENSVKFVLPTSLKPGVFSVQVLAGGQTSAPHLLNVPEIWFAQPTTLRPGLDANEFPPGDATVQVIGKNFTVRGAATPAPQIELLPQGGAALGLTLVKAEPFSLTAQLPATLAPGAYTLRISNGHGGTAAWSAPLAVTIKAPDVWPDKVFNVRDFGAKGDDVTDDTAALRAALAAAEKNGGGIVLLPWGTYRLSDWIGIPERTILRGEKRDATILKWPIDPPQSEKDFIPAAVFIGARCGLEDLTLVARKVETIIVDVQAELNGRTVPPEMAPRVVPFGHSRDIFFRRLAVQHYLMAGRPEQDKVAATNPALMKQLWQGKRNARLAEGRNFEISGCDFQGGDQQFTNLANARLTDNRFSNTMNYCWTQLGGGAHDTVCQNNTLDCSSSWGWGWSNLERIYSAHNTSNNFVRGEREAMTLDISALPTARPISQYWGTPVEVGGGKDKPFLRFAAGATPNADGFVANFVPGCFTGGSAIIHAFNGGTGANQNRAIVGNTADTIYLEKPFSPAPDTTPHRMYIEIAPRHAHAHIGTTAWLGHLAASEPGAFTAKEAHWIPQEFAGMTALVLDGPGSGQYRMITANTADHAALERPWDITPDATSTVGIWSLMRHMIVYDCQCRDTSAFAQLYGSFYDYIVDGCRVERTQGIWGQMGWFVQFRDNSVSYGNSYHPGIGMPGPNPEHRAPFGYTGLDGSKLRITKSQAFQYPERKLPLFADDILPAAIPSTLGLILRGNTLSYNQRLVIEPWSGDKAPGPRPQPRVRDVVIDGNHIAHSAVGIQIGPNVRGSLLGKNDFDDVAQPVLDATTPAATRP